MSKLPNANEAIVPPLKLTHYLLDLTSKQGKAKAQFFLAFGFTIEAWQVMADALRLHAVSYDVATIRETPYGVHYVIEEALETPDGRNPNIKTVWKILNEEQVPSFVTAYPD